MGHHAPTHCHWGQQCNQLRWHVLAMALCYSHYYCMSLDVTTSEVSILGQPLSQLELIQSQQELPELSHPSVSLFLSRCWVRRGRVRTESPQTGNGFHTFSPPSYSWRSRTWWGRWPEPSRTFSDIEWYPLALLWNWANSTSFFTTNGWFFYAAKKQHCHNRLILTQFSKM